MTHNTSCHAYSRYFANIAVTMISLRRYTPCSSVLGKQLNRMTALTPQASPANVPTSLSIQRPGIGVPEYTGGYNRRLLSGFFGPAAWLHPCYGRAVRGGLRTRRPSDRYANPHGSAHPNWRLGAEFRPQHRKGSPCRTALKLRASPCSPPSIFTVNRSQSSPPHPANSSSR